MNENRAPPWTVLLGCAISVAICIWDIVQVMSDQEVFVSWSFLAIALALNALPLIFTLIACFRRNWGRIALAVLTALGVLILPLDIFLGEEAAGPLDAETVLYSLAEVIILVLLFAPASNKWYRRPRVQPA